MRVAPIALTLFLAACAAAPLEPAPASVEADRLMEDVRTLSSDEMQGRAPGTEGSALAREYILGRFAEIGLDPAIGDKFEQPFIFTENGQARQGVNLLARIDGASRSRRTMVVTAHYDHVGVVDGQIYNGADDNASGVAVLLAIAEEFALRPPRHDVIIAALDAEEGGARGARVLVSDPPLPLDLMELNVNLDMLSRSDRNELYVAGASHFPFLKKRLETIASNAEVNLKLGHDSPAWGEGQDWTAESDHVAFHEKGIAWVYFGVEDHPDYHKPTDDFETISQDFFRRSARTVVEAVRALNRDLDAIADEAAAAR